MFELKVEHSFPAGHALRGYQGKCANPHGHNYRIQVTVRGAKLNDIGLLLDFSDLKHSLRAICEELDHQYLNDLPAFAERNPSAENLALHIYEQMTARMAAALRDASATVTEVTVQETDTAWAVYRPD